MIDRIQQTLEGLAPELEDYAKRRIFTSREISKIIETRRRFESKLQRSNKKLEDFMQYVESEKKLEKVRNRRIEKSHATVSETDVLLSKNIIRVYKLALHRFSEPIIVKDFAEYCIKRKYYAEMKDTFAAKCLKNLRDTDLIIFCAQKLWEVDDIENARNLFLKILGVSRDARLLVEFFRLECAYAEKINKINRELGIEEEEKGDIEKGEVAMVIFRSLVRNANENEIQECVEISKIVPGLVDRIMDCYSSL